MSLMQWLFPVGMALTSVGLLSELLLDASRGFRILDLFGPIMPFCLLGGALLIIAGLIIDVRRLPAIRARRRGIVCWIITGLSILLMVIHHWGFDDTTIFLSLPALCGFVGGFVLFLFSKG